MIAAITESIDRGGRGFYSKDKPINAFYCDTCLVFDIPWLERGMLRSVSLNSISVRFSACLRDDIPVKQHSNVVWNQPRSPKRHRLIFMYTAWREDNNSGANENPAL